MSVKRAELLALGMFGIELEGNQFDQGSLF